MATAPLAQTLLITNSGVFTQPTSAVTIPTGEITPPTLATLTLSGALRIGTSTSGTISGATVGSTIVSNIPGITVNSAARTYTGTPTGSAATIANGLVETLAGATGSPKSNSIVVSAALSPTQTTAPTITTDGTPQVSETLTGVNGTFSNGTVQSVAWLLGGTSMSTSQTYAPSATGQLIFRNIVTGAGGTANFDSAPVTVATATPGPTPTPTPTPGVTIPANPAGATVTIASLADTTLRLLDTASPSQEIALDTMTAKNSIVVVVGRVNATGGGIQLQYGNQDYSFLRPLNADGSDGGSIYWQAANNTIAGGDRFRLTNLDGVVTLRLGSTVLFTGTFAGLGTYVSVHEPYYGSFGVGPTTNISYGAIATPLSIVSLTVDASFRPTVLIDYTGSPLSYKLQLFEADGVTPIGGRITPDITIISASRLRLAAPTSSTGFGAGQYGTVPKVGVFEVAQNGTESGVTKQIGYTMPAAPARLGVNMDYQGLGFNNRTLLNLWTTSNYQYYDATANPGDPNGNYAKVGTDIDDNGNPLRMAYDSTGNPVGSMLHGIGFPTDNLVAMNDGTGRYTTKGKIRWKGTFTFTLENAVFTNVSGVQTDGTWNWKTFDWTVIPDGSSYGPAYVTGVGAGATLANSIHVAECDTSGNFLFDPATNEFHPTNASQIAAFKGVRVMDMQNGAGISYTPLTLANRSKFIWGPDSWAIELLMRFAVKLQMPLSMTLPAQANDAYIRFVADQIVDTLPSLPVGSIFKVSGPNEPWNSGQGAWQYYAALGASRGYSGTQNDQALKASSAEYTRMMTVFTDQCNVRGKVSAGKITGIDRQVNTANDGNGYAAGLQCEFDAGAMALVDTITIAPYAGIYAAVNPSLTTDVAVVVDRIRTDITTRMNNASVLKAYATSKGKKFECYEGGFEQVGNNMDTALSRSPLVAQLTADYLNAYNTTIGGPGVLHWYSWMRRTGQYGLRENLAQGRTTSLAGMPPAYKYDEALKFIAATTG